MLAKLSSNFFHNILFFGVAVQNFAKNELFCGINGKLKEIIILKEVCEIKS